MIDFHKCNLCCEVCDAHSPVSDVHVFWIMMLYLWLSDFKCSDIMILED
jgi:hypothetical protein